MLRVHVAQLVPHHGEHLRVVELVEQVRVDGDGRLLAAVGGRVGMRRLGEEQRGLQGQVQAAA
jgi:hypothetical protein